MKSSNVILKKFLFLQIFQVHFGEICNINNFWNLQLPTFLCNLHIANIVVVISCKN
jgi:hypothetical protein